VVNVFGNTAAPTAPAVFKPKAAGEDGDFGPRLQLTAPAIENGKAVYPPNPAYLGKALIIDVKGPVTYTAETDSGPKEKTAVDAIKVTVVETGEVFEDQRIFQAGVVRQLLDYTGQQVIAAVGEYTSKKRAGRFVELVAPTEAQQAAANKLLAATVEPPF